MTVGAGCHPNKVKVSGPGVAKSGLKAFEPTYFTVDCSEAGQGEQRHRPPRLPVSSLHFLPPLVWAPRWAVTCTCTTSPASGSIAPDDGEESAAVQRGPVIPEGAGAPP